MKRFLQYNFLILLSILTFTTVKAQEVVWAKGFDSYNAKSIAVDHSSNVYTCGYFSGTIDFDPSAVNTYTLSSNGGKDIYITKFDMNGVFVWAKRMGGTGDDNALAIKIDAADNIYTSGFFMNTVDFDPSLSATYTLTALGPVGYEDAFISKLDVNGNFLWAKRFGGTDDERANAMTLDVSGNIYTTGFFQYAVDFDPSPTSTYIITPPNNASTVFISKLDPSGNFVFAKQLGVGEGRAIEIDQLGNIYSTGLLSDISDFDPSPTSTYSLAITNSSIYFSKLDAAGNFIWAKNVGSNTTGGYQTTYVNDLAIDNSGNVYATGGFQGATDFDPSATGTYTLPYANGYHKIFALKLDANGNFVWVNRFGSDNLNQWGTAIAVDAANNAFFTGYYNGPCDFDPSASVYTLPLGSSLDGFICKLTTSGTLGWARNLKGSISSGTGSAGNDILLDGSGSMYLCGSFNGTIDFDPSSTGVYNVTGIASGGSFVAKYCDAPGITSTIPGYRCKTGTVTLSANSSAGIINWYSGSSGGTSLGTGSTFLTPSLSVTTTYYAEASNLTCKSLRIPITANINNTVYTSSRSLNICSSSNLVYNNHTYTTSGTYKDTLHTALGCDSIVTTHLLVSNTINTAQSFSICPGTTTSIGSQTYNTSGSYSQTLTAIGGCDSIVSLQLGIFPATVSNQSITICAGQSISVGAFTHSITANYTDTLLSGHGCDSIVQTHLTVLPAIILNQSQTIYSGQSISTGIHTYSTTGQYIDVLTASNGCDSTIQTTLSVIAKSLYGEDWNIIHPKPTSNNFFSIVFPDANTGYAVGGTGTILKTTDAGTNWMDISVDRFYELYDTYFTGVDTGYAIGYHVVTYDPVIMKTTNGGLTWILLNSPPALQLTSVHFTDSRTGYIVGYQGKIYKTTNGGATWNSQTSGTSANLWSVHFINSTTGHACGDNGTILYTTNGGANWTAQSSGTSATLKNILFTSATNGYCAGTGSILRTTNGGVSWILFSIGTQPLLNSIYFTSATVGYVTGYYNEFYTTINGGVNWTLSYNLNSLQNSIVFTGPATGYIACMGGLIKKTINAASSWTDVTPNHGNDYYKALCFADADEAYAVGSAGTIHKITNHGLTITPQASGTNYDLYSVHFPVKDTGYAVGQGGVIVKTINGGANWTMQFSNTSIYFFSTFFINTYTGWAVGGNGVIYKTSDGGTTWTGQPNPNAGTYKTLNSVYFTDPSTGYAVGGVDEYNQTETCIILKTTNGGSTWSALSSGNPYAVYAVQFTSVDTGYIVGRAGKILKTVNRGATWLPQNSGTSASLEAEHFLNSNIGYAVGQDGTMLKTVNGGANWMQIPSGTDNDLMGINFDKFNFGYGVGFYQTIIKRGLSAEYTAVSLCAGDSTTLGAYSVGGMSPNSYSWSNGMSGFLIHVKPSVTTVYTYTVTDNSTLSAIGNYTVTVNSIPGSGISGNGSILTSGSSSGNQWLLNNVPISGATAQTYTVTQPGNYSIITTLNGCPSDTSNFLFVLPLSASVNSVSICAGDSVLITATGTGGLPPYSYRWNTNATSNSLMVKLPVTTIYSYTLTDANLLTATGYYTVAIKPNPTPFVSRAGAVLSSSRPAGNQWYLNNIPIPGATAQSYTFTQSGNYSVVTSTNTCISAASNTVIITALSAVNNQTIICGGDSVLITASSIGGVAPLSYMWSTGSASVSIRVKPNITSIYNYTVTDLISQSITAQYTVNVLPNPTPTITVSGSVLNSSQLTGNQWYFNNTLISGTTAQTYTATQNGNYFVITTSNGCVSKSSNTVTAIAFIASGNQTILCAGDSALITASATGGLSPFTVQWSNGPSGNTILVKPLITTVYTYTVTDANTQSALGHYTVTVKPNPTPIITMSGSILTSNNFSGNQWYINNTLIPGATGQTYTVTQAGNYSVITGTNGCISDTSNRINANAFIASNTQALLCSGDSILISAASSGGLNPLSYHWNNTATSGSIFVKPIVTTVYTYTVTDGNMQSVIGHYTVNVTPNPTPSITINGSVITSDQPVGNLWYLNGVMIPGATAQSYTMTQNGDYSVITTANGCISAPSNTINTSPLSINNYSGNSEFEVYPNPTYQFIFIKTGNKDTENTVIIYDSHSKEVIRKTYTGNITEIDLGSLAGGLYFVELISGDRIYTGKIMKE